MPGGEGRKRKRGGGGENSLPTPSSLFRQLSLASFSYVREDRQERRVACVRCGGYRRHSGGGGSREDMEHEPAAVEIGRAHV